MYDGQAFVVHQCYARFFELYLKITHKRVVIVKNKAPVSQDGAHSCNIPCSEFHSNQLRDDAISRKPVLVVFECLQKNHIKDKSSSRHKKTEKGGILTSQKKKSNTVRELGGQEEKKKKNTVHFNSPVILDEATVLIYSCLHACMSTTNLLFE